MNKYRYILSPEEVQEITSYKIPEYQLRELKKSGIPVKKMRDNSIRVWRKDLEAIAHQLPIEKTGVPRLKSSISR